MRMEALVVTTVLTGHARTNTDLVWIRGINNVAKHAEN